MGWFGRMPFTLIGLKWDIHLTDEDTRPSIPHLHGVEDNRYKINIYTGEVSWDNKPAGQLRNNEWQMIWQDETFLKTVKRARTYYLEHHPNANLPAYPIFEKKENSSKLILETKLTPSGLNLTATKPKKLKKQQKEYSRD